MVRWDAPLVFVLLLFFPGCVRQEPGFVSLFDGRSLEGWVEVGKKGPRYRVEEGVLMCPGKGARNLFSQKEYSNFILRFEFRLEEGSNNGLGIRAPLEGDAAYEGMEIQILDNQAPVYRDKLKPAQYHGSVYDVFPARQGFLKNPGEWNREEVIADGRHITVKLNGTVILDEDLDSVKDPETLKKHPGLARTSGHIGFFGHDTWVEFRKIRIKELND